jgi:tetratricopeptide (TPR) repeat protein
VEWKAVSEVLSAAGVLVSAIHTEQELVALIDRHFTPRITAYWRAHRTAISTPQSATATTTPATTPPVPTQSPDLPSSPIVHTLEERMALEALDAMNEGRLTEARDRAVAALAIDAAFVPALLLLRAIRLHRPLVFKPGDVTVSHALERAKSAPAPAKHHGRRFLEQHSSGARLFLLAYFAEKVDCNVSEAVRLYRRVGGTHPGAMTCLGKCYEEGQGVAKDVAEATRLYRAAAERGHAQAQFNLGTLLYSAGDHVEAARWFRASADQGHSQACNNLAVCYDNGYGVQKNPTEGTKWHRAAAVNV